MTDQDKEIGRLRAELADMRALLSEVLDTVKRDDYHVSVPGILPLGWTAKEFMVDHWRELAGIEAL